MNGKPEKAVHIVDRKAEKIKEVNRKVNRVFQKKQDDWSFVPKAYIDGMRLFGSILMIPIVIVAAILEGVKAGFIAGLQKALTLYR